jgi:hypothetical protein
MKRLLAAPRRVLAVGALAAVAIVVAAGFGYAAVAADNRTYTGCLQSGTLTNIAIGATPMKACAKNATEISWSQTGPPGTPGTNGINGTNGVSVTSATEAAGANCADGGSKFTAANANVTYACNGAKGDKGDQGIQGEKGDPGASAKSLAGVPCDTGSIDRPDGETTVAVAPTTGVITLTCVSASTNPKLVVSLGSIVFGTSVLWYGGVSEVDANGLAVPQGFVCQRSNGAFLSCSTQRFAPGSTVRLRTGSLEPQPVAGWSPGWTGCDSISADRLTCTLSLPATGTVPVGLAPTSS